MSELKKLEEELYKVLKENAERPNPELLKRANQLRIAYAELDVKLNGGKK